MCCIRILASPLPSSPTAPPPLAAASSMASGRRPAFLAAYLLTLLLLLEGRRARRAQGNIQYADLGVLGRVRSALRAISPSTLSDLIAVARSALCVPRAPSAMPGLCSEAEVRDFLSELPLLGHGRRR